MILTAISSVIPGKARSTALGAVFVHPEFAVRPQRGALGVAVAVAPDLGQGAGLACKGVARGHRTVGSDADDLAVVVVQLLRIVLAVVALAQGHQQVAVRGLHDAAAKMQRTFNLGALAEDHAHVLQAARIGCQGGACHGRAVARSAGSGF